MGICSSCESTSVVTTVKLILQDGKLQEFRYPVKASYVHEKNPTNFICDADNMDLDSLLSAIKDDEYLTLGQIYFLLPVSWLGSRLQLEEMASLAVKASLALKTSGGVESYCRCHRKKVDPLMLSCRREDRFNNQDCRRDGELFRERRDRRRHRGVYQRQSFSTNLSIILEE